ncbi:MAG: 16S rRNA (adenine(1518)-N(6)/adenine(1519)-N(6))-dimethyltransferase RsmA [Gammaproteobacteria bacterium]
MRAKKRFGQHFLHDPAIQRRILEAVDPKPHETILEIGPGHGALTRLLLERIPSLWAVEIDRDLAQELVAGWGERLKLRVEDALTLDFRVWPEVAPFRVVGNLPYNVASPLLARLAKVKDRIQDLHVMLQEEVAARIVARAGEVAYGRWSVFMAYHFIPETLFRVSRGAFSPPPRVQSAFIRLIPRREPPFPVGDPELYFSLVAQAFQGRRKMLQTSLKAHASRALLTRAGLDPCARPATVPPEGFAALARLISAERSSA